MHVWARQWGVSINKGIFFSKLALDNIVNLRFNPGGGAAYFETAEKGISILLCQSRTGDEKKKTRQHKLTKEISTNNRTLSKALTLFRKDGPRAPPDTYQDLKANVGTFCAFLWALFGDTPCEYYRKCFELHTCLDSVTVSEKWQFFTPLLCRQISWAI